MKLFHKHLKYLEIINRKFRIKKMRKALQKGNITHLYIGSPIHSNLGDQQIRNSSIEFFDSLKINYLEISSFDYFAAKHLDFSTITTICLHGGGNIGDVYPIEEYLREDVIRTFRDKKIIIMPQTIHFDNPNSEESKIIRTIFASHKNLYLTARENISFAKMKELFSTNNILLTPDIVTSSDYSKKQYKRKGCLCLMRRDGEKALSAQAQSRLINSIAKLGYKVKLSDTVIKYDPYSIKRDCELQKLFKLIKKAQVVVTDRLHGMVFCAITNTPCIVLPNYNHKVKSTYTDWLSHLDYIHFEEDINNLDVKAVMEKFAKSKDKWQPLTDKFEPLRSIL